MNTEPPVEASTFTGRTLSKLQAGFRFLLYERTILMLWVLAVIGVMVMAWYVARLQSDLIASTALQNAATYAETLAEFRTLYTSEVVDAVSGHGIDDFGRVERAKLGEGLAVERRVLEGHRLDDTRLEP